MKENNFKTDIKTKENKKPDIKIFVSHRIDMDAETIDNPLYVNVRCGAVFDKRENVDMLGDNTGDNISEKRDMYSEFTVQYWAWKNIEADYYGLCHYRRYLSFIDEYIDCDEPHRFAVEKYIDKKNVKKYGLLSKKNMIKEIQKYDIITSIDYEVCNLPFYPKPKNEYELWLNHPILLICNNEIELILEMIKVKYPMYYETALELMQSNVHKGFNCFIMKKELFYQMCEFEFSILFEIEKKLDYTKYAGYKERIMGYLGEILYGVFMLYIKKQNKYKIKETQIILFTQSQKRYRWKRNFILKERIKKILQQILPAYHTILRVEEKINKMQNSIENDINILKKAVNTIQSKENIKFWSLNPIFPNNLETVKKDFWRSFPKANGDLRLIQKANTKLLERFKEICDKLKITFWLHGGSLIGSVRHSGCIPWDDDIDIGMMRSDFNKIKEYLIQSDNYEIAEYYYTGLACRSYRFKRKNLEYNFFIDIFLYDNYNNEYEDILDDWKKMLTFKRGLLHQWKQFLQNNNIDYFNNQRLDDEPKLKNFLDTLINMYIDKFKNLKPSNCITWGIDNNFENHTRYAWHHGRIFYNYDMFPLKESTYEGKTYLIPANYEKYAFAEYGIDYLEMPNDIGISVHINEYFKNVDIKKAYKELIETEKLIKNFI